MPARKMNRAIFVLVIGCFLFCGLLFHRHRVMQRNQPKVTERLGIKVTIGNLADAVFRGQIRLGRGCRISWHLRGFRENAELSPAREPPRHLRMTSRAARGNSQAYIPTSTNHLTYDVVRALPAGPSLGSVSCHPTFRRGRVSLVFIRAHD